MDLLHHIDWAAVGAAGSAVLVAMLTLFRGKLAALTAQMDGGAHEPSLRDLVHNTTAAMQKNTDAVNGLRRDVASLSTRVERIENERVA